MEELRDNGWVQAIIFYVSYGLYSAQVQLNYHLW